MKKIYFELMHETEELKAQLLEADWEFDYDDYEWARYSVEIDGETYYKVEYEHDITYTDDPAEAAGYAWEYEDDDDM